MSSLSTQSAFTIKSVFIPVVLIFVVGCRKMLEVPTPSNQLVAVDVFSDSATANAAMIGLYSSMYNGNTSTPFRDQITLLAGRAADEFELFTSSDLDPFGKNEILVEDGNVLNMWTHFYYLIYQANTIISRIDDSRGISARFRDQLKAEGTFIRAVSHFYLTNLFGDVPVILSTDIEKNKHLPRMGQKEVFDQIILDLKYAQSQLSGDYNYISPTRIRATKWAATSLLSRVYLYAGDYLNAEKESSVVIGSSLFDLPPVQNVFLGSSKEAIWRFPTSAMGYTYVQQIVSPNSAGIPTYVLRKGLMSAFEIGDQRREKWIGSKNYSNVLYYYPSKYKRTAQNRTAPEEYESILRLAEQYLIRAEARVKLNNITGARQDLNMIRNRAGLSSLNVDNAVLLLSAIEQEKRIEFFAEYGHRWLDLKRTGRVNAVLSELKPSTWSITDALFPIPQQARNTNINLTQNPGYPQ